MYPHPAKPVWLIYVSTSCYTSVVNIYISNPYQTSVVDICIYFLLNQFGVYMFPPSGKPLLYYVLAPCKPCVIGGPGIEKLSLLTSPYPPLKVEGVTRLEQRLARGRRAWLVSLNSQVNVTSLPIGCNRDTS